MTVDLNSGMKIEVVTVLTGAPAGAVTGGRPAYLPAGAMWPVPDSTIIIYAVCYADGTNTAKAVCSRCVRDDAVVASYLGYLTSQAYGGDPGYRLGMLDEDRNGRWICTVRESDGGCGGTGGTKL